MIKLLVLLPISCLLQFNHVSSLSSSGLQLRYERSADHTKGAMNFDGSHSSFRPQTELRHSRGMPVSGGNRQTFGAWGSGDHHPSRMALGSHRPSNVGGGHRYYRGMGTSGGNRLQNGGSHHSSVLGNSRGNRHLFLRGNSGGNRNLFHGRNSGGHFNIASRPPYHTLFRQGHLISPPVLSNVPSTLFNRQHPAFGESDYSPPRNFMRRKEFMTNKTPSKSSITITAETNIWEVDEPTESKVSDVTIPSFPTTKKPPIIIFTTTTKKPIITTTTTKKPVILITKKPVIPTTTTKKPIITTTTTKKPVISTTTTKKPIITTTKKPVIPTTTTKKPIITTTITTGNPVIPTTTTKKPVIPTTKEPEIPSEDEDASWILGGDSPNGTPGVPVKDEDTSWILEGVSPNGTPGVPDKDKKKEDKKPEYEYEYVYDYEYYDEHENETGNETRNRLEDGWELVGESEVVGAEPKVHAAMPVTKNKEKKVKNSGKRGDAGGDGTKRTSRKQHKEGIKSSGQKGN